MRLTLNGYITDFYLPHFYSAPLLRVRNFAEIFVDSKPESLRDGMAQVL